MLNIFHSAADAPETIPPNSLVNDYFEAAILKIADGSVDAVIIDPPYTDGQSDALPNHKIQTKIDIAEIIRHVHRILKSNGFFVFFGQMPTVLAWLNAAQSTFKYREHITWCKRNITSPYLPIQRSKEDIFIYAKGKPAYCETQEKYEDLKMAGVDLGLYDLQTMKTTLSDLQRRVKDNAYNMLYFQGITVGDSHLDNSLATLPAPTGETGEDFADKTFEELDKLQDKITSRSDHNCKTLRYTSKDRLADDFEELDKAQPKNTAHGDGNDNWLSVKLPNAAREKAEKRLPSSDKDFEDLDKQEKAFKPLSKYRNDGLMQHAFQKTLENRAAAEFDENREKGKQVGYQDPASNDKSWNKGRQLKTAHRYRSKHWCNITNTWYFHPEPADRAAAEICTVWSYLSQNQTKMGKDGENWKHPTVKPVKLLERLIKLLTPEPQKAGYSPLIVDFFLGSGTTTLAAANLKRNFIGVELQPDYFAMCCARTEAALGGRAVNSAEVNNPAPAAAPTTNKQLGLF